MRRNAGFPAQPPNKKNKQKWPFGLLSFSGHWCLESIRSRWERCPWRGETRACHTTTGEQNARQGRKDGESCSEAGMQPRHMVSCHCPPNLLSLGSLGNLGELAQPTSALRQEERERGPWGVSAALHIEEPDLSPVGCCCQTSLGCVSLAWVPAWFGDLVFFLCVRGPSCFPLPFLLQGAPARPLLR